MQENELTFMEHLEHAAKSMVSYNLNTIISEFDERIYISLVKKDRLEAEGHLSDLCFAFINMPEEDQLYTLKIYFISMVTGMMLQNYRNDFLLPNKMAYDHAMIQTINKWKYTSEVFSSVPWFIDKLMTEPTSHINFIVQNLHIEKALQLISSNLKNKELSVCWLAGKLDIASTYLSSIFKFEVGETIISYINKRKVEQIAFELKYTNKLLGDLHLEYGYPNKSYFIQVFKKYVGQTPLKYKRNLFK